MKTLIEKWNGAGNDWDEWDGMHIDEVIGKCASDLTDACTPRAPRPEWFGTGPGQWDCWWVSTSIPSAPPRIIRGCLLVCDCIGQLDNRDWLPLRVVTGVVPVVREGFPSPVGWQVVEGDGQ